MSESKAATLNPDGVRATILCCLFFAGFGCLIPHLPTWLADTQGFTGVQISLVLTVGGLSRIVAGPLTAAWAAGQKDSRAPLFLFAFLLTAGFAALWFVKPFWAVFTIILLMDVGFWGLLPAVEAALIRLTKTGLPAYGVARGLASAAFIVGSSAVGALVAGFGPWAIWGWLLGVSIALIIAAWIMPREHVESHPEESFVERLRDGVGLLKDRRFTLLIFAAGIIQATHGYFYGFGVLIWTKDQGISQTLAGNLWSVGVAVEVLFLMFLGGWSSRFAPETLVLVGGIASVIRWTLLAMAPPVWLLWFCQILHAGTFAATFLGAMRLVNQMVGDERTATAQMIYMALASAPAQAFTTFISGFLYDWLQPQGHAAWGYLSMTAVSVVGLVLALMLWTKREPVAGLVTA